MNYLLTLFIGFCTVSASVDADETVISDSSAKYEMVDVETQMKLGDGYLEENKLHEARDAYKKGFEAQNLTESDQVDLYWRLGGVQRDLGHYRAAIEAFKKGISLKNVSDNEKAPLYVDLAVLYKEEKDWAAVEKTSVEGLLLYNINNYYLVLLYHRLAEAKFHLHKVEQAETAYINALSLNGLPPEDRAGLYMGYGKLFVKAHEYENAVEKFSEGRNVSGITNDWEGRFDYEIGFAQLELGNRKSAQEAFQRGLALSNLSDGTIEKLQDGLDQSTYRLLPALFQSNLLVTVLGIIGAALLAYIIVVHTAFGLINQRARNRLKE